jgi:xylan 1,4-beta-xylosidase
MLIQMKASARDPGRPLKHFWSVCVGAGRANEGLRANWLEQLRHVREKCAFQYVRFHGLFHDDMFVYREVNGEPVYNFQYVDELFDRLLHIGVRPFVELGFCPGDLATQKGTVFWWKANGSPPKDYSRWEELVGRLVTHCVDRYGIDEVRQWYFEVWNEPNLHPFFKGTKSQYFELYKVSVRAIRQIDSQLRVGGPSTSNFVPDARFDGETEDVSQHRVVTKAADLDALDWKPAWLAQFLEFCRSNDLPLDFVSAHPYPTDWALDELGHENHYTRGVDSTRNDLRLLRRMIDASHFPRAQIHLTEWSSSPSPRDHTHDHLQAATYVVKCNVESAGLVDSLSYWTFTDVFEEGGAGNTPFHGGFGMINFQGIPKPTFHAYRMLHLLGDEILQTAPGSIVTRHQTSGRLTALAYHYPEEMKLAVPSSISSRELAQKTLGTGSSARLSIDLSGLRPGARVAVETLGQDSGNALGAWTTMGQPDPLSRKQAAELRELAGRTRSEIFQANDAGRFSLERSIDPWNVVMVREEGKE